MDVLIILIGLILILTAIIGSLVPIFPSLFLAYASLLLLHFSKVFQYRTSTLVALAFLMLLVILVDYVLPYFGTKKLGGTRYGTVGATLGLFVSLFFTPFFGWFILPGMMLCSFTGAFWGEKIHKQENQVALKSALGAVLGILFSTIMRIVYCGVILFVFLIGVCCHFQFKWGCLFSKFM